MTCRLRPTLLALLAALAGCASPPPASDPQAQAEFRETNDPLEPTNRVFYRINNGIDTVLLKPAAQAYRFVFPNPVRVGIHNALANLSTPVILSNDMLQARSRRAGDTLMRFAVNSTLGLGGVLDPATGLGYPAHDSSFGTTLALWGVPDGPFLYLPVLGPTNPRDASGFGVDLAIDPFTWVGQGTTVTVLNYSRFAISAIDTRERLLDPVDQIQKTALDPYATFRSLYRQHRASEIAEVENDRRHTVPAWFPRPASGQPIPASPAPADSETNRAAPATDVPSVR